MVLAILHELQGGARILSWFS